jgi:hypothetical protein
MIKIQYIHFSINREYIYDKMTQTLIYGIYNVPPRITISVVQKYKEIADAIGNFIVGGTKESLF